MLKAAIDSLEKGNPKHFTNDDQPREDVVSEMVGREDSRKEITEAMLAPQEPIARAQPEPELTAAEKFHEADLLLNEKLKQLAIFQEEIKTLEYQRAALEQRAGISERTPQQDTEARMAYIKMQNEIRAAKANEANEIRKKLGIPSSVKSPLDLAMSPHRGKGRPKFGRTT